MFKPKDEISVALRSGYFHEHFSKGNRNYGTIGTGIKYKFLYFDLAYLIDTKQSATANTININLGFQKVLN